jgi:hypothetical protein
MNKDILKTPLLLTWAVLVFVGTLYVSDFIENISGVNPFRNGTSLQWYVFIISWILVSFGLSFFVQMVWEKTQRKD